MKNKISTEKKYLDEKLKPIFIKLINSNSNFDFLEYHKLIENNFENQENIAYIIHYLYKEIKDLEKLDDKLKILHLFSEFYSYLTTINSDSHNFSLKFNLYCKYTSRILTVLQKIILMDITPDKISEIFGKIIFELFSKKISREKEIKRMIKTTEIIQGFCFYNMKQSLYINQKIGVLCLKELISKTEYYINNKKYIKNFFEKIILFLENNNFEPKEDLLELFSIFIKKCDKLFEPYINITLYKLLNLIEDDSINIRRKIIDIIVLIISDFPHEFLYISNSLIKFFNILIINNDDIYLKNKCQEALSLLNNLCFYSTFNKLKEPESNINLLKTSKSPFYKRINKKSDSLVSKSTRYNSSNKSININRNIAYSSKYNILKKNQNFERIFHPNLIIKYQNKILRETPDDDKKKNK